jgi:hypothetical protein
LANRPCLAGNPAFELEGLDSVDWGRLSDAYGHALATPAYLRALTTEHPADHAFAEEGLYAATTHQGSVCSAAEAAVPFLVELVRRAAPGRAVAAWALQRIAVGEAHFVMGPEDLAVARLDTVALVARGAEAYLEALEAFPGSGFERLLAVLPHPTRRAADAVVSMLQNVELGAEARGSAALSLALLSWQLKTRAYAEELWRTLEEGTDPRLRLASAVGLAWVLGPDAGDELRALLASVCLLDEARDWEVAWPWSREVMPMVEQAWLCTLSDRALVERSEGRLRGLALGEALRRGWGGFRGRALPTEVTPFAREALRLGLSHGLDTLGEHPPLPGLPRSSAARRRLAGMGEPGALDRACDAAAPLFVCRPPLWAGFEAVAEGRLSAAALAGDIVEHTTDLPAFLAECCADQDLLGMTSGPAGLDHRHVRLLEVLALAALADGASRAWLEAQTAAQRRKVSELRGYDLAFKADTTIIGLCLVAASTDARRMGTGLSDDAQALVQIYHPHPEHSRVPLEVLAGALRCAPPERQRRVVAPLALYVLETRRARYPEHAEEPLWSAQVDAIRPTEAWSLLRACRGPWVVERVFDAMRAWGRVGAQERSVMRLFAGGHRPVIEPLPREAAIDALRMQVADRGELRAALRDPALDADLVREALWSAS